LHSHLTAQAVFGATLVVPAHLTALSNMPEEESTLLPGGLKRVKFADSPKMSTYLLAFCVGEFDFVQTTSKHGVQIRVYTPPGKAEQGRFSLSCASRVLDLYDDFFGVPYPLPKLDMIAIPEFAMVRACYFHLAIWFFSSFACVIIFNLKYTISQTYCFRGLWRIGTRTYHSFLWK
jgi:aminopeptidase N